MGEFKKLITQIDDLELRITELEEKIRTWALLRPDVFETTFTPGGGDDLLGDNVPWR